MGLPMMNPENVKAETIVVHEFIPDPQSITYCLSCPREAEIKHKRDSDKEDIRSLILNAGLTWEGLIGREQTLDSS